MQGIDFNINRLLNIVSNNSTNKIAKYHADTDNIIEGRECRCTVYILILYIPTNIENYIQTK